MSQIAELDEIVSDLYGVPAAEALGATHKQMRNSVIEVIARINRCIPDSRQNSADPRIIDSAAEALKAAVEQLVDLNNEPLDSPRRADLFVKALDRVESASDYLGGRFAE